MEKFKLILTIIFHTFIEKQIENNMLSFYILIHGIIDFLTAYFLIYFSNFDIKLFYNQKNHFTMKKTSSNVNNSS